MQSDLQVTVPHFGSPEALKTSLCRSASGYAASITQQIENTMSESTPRPPNIFNKLYSKDDYKREAHIYENDHVEREGYRSDFRRDYARLIHAPSFRRLQGKTQIFPGAESDFFRNRLTHSMEVAQIAKSIAIRLNSKPDFGNDYQIDTDLVEFAGLAHDLGHPPFGHTGEDALAECMKEHGGFEGNAQTLRILARLEKRALTHEKFRKYNGVYNNSDERKGLNLTYRSLASIIKYDKSLSQSLLEQQKSQGRSSRAKGYYDDESQVVEHIRVHVAPGSDKGKLKVIECDIMDIADDIAYASSDLEDSFKAGFLSPMDMLAVDEELRKTIAKELSSKLGSSFTARKVQDILDSIVADFIFDEDQWVGLEWLESDAEELDYTNGEKDADDDSRSPRLIRNAAYAHIRSRALARNSYFRTRLISSLIGIFIRGTNIDINKDHPSLSSVKIDEDVRIRIETLKHFTYHYQVMSPRLKVVEFRGREIVKKIFKTLSSDNGSMLLPSDFKETYHSFRDDTERKRLVCDFIAGMTDRYALEYYARITTEQAQTIFKPL